MSKQIEWRQRNIHDPESTNKGLDLIKEKQTWLKASHHSWLVTGQEARQGVLNVIPHPLHPTLSPTLTSTSTATTHPLTPTAFNTLTTSHPAAGGGAEGTDEGQKVTDTKPIAHSRLGAQGILTGTLS